MLRGSTLSFTHVPSEAGVSLKGDSGFLFGRLLVVRADTVCVPGADFHEPAISQLS
jgi:hypothetical protein